jgi:hypothetical protein
MYLCVTITAERLHRVAWIFPRLSAGNVVEMMNRQRVCLVVTLDAPKSVSRHDFEPFLLPSRILELL